MKATLAQVREYARGEAVAYGGDDQVDVLRRHAGVVATYAAAVAAAAALARARGRHLPAQFSPYEVALLATATHKAARTLSKAKVTSPVRAPFTRFREHGGPAELNEEPREEGGPVRRAIGELLACPFCLDVWIATALGMGLVCFPRATRAGSGVLSALAGADFLHLAYARLQ